MSRLTPLALFALCLIFPFVQTAADDLKMRADIDRRITAFAAKKPIAEKADALLSKLLVAQSPVINSWIDARNLRTKPEDETVKQWRLYFAKNFVLSKYPGESAKLDHEVEKLVDGILKDHMSAAFRAKMEKLVARAKKSAVETIQTFKIAASPAIIKRVEAIKLYWPTNLKTARNNSVPLEIIDWGIAYDPGANEINMGVNAVSYPNDETYLAVFAHEIGHAFDSCRWTAYFDGAWPFAKVGQCLRTGESVGAKTRDDSQLAGLTKTGKISETLALALAQNPTCNKLVYPPVGVQADQLPESFADWFSAEVVARLSDLDPKKIRSDLFDSNSKTLVEGSSYPSNVRRLRRIYFAQPTLQAKFAARADEDVHYCPLN